MPSRGESWSREEVEATVASYLEMLEAGLRGDAFNKTAYRNALIPLLAGRTAGSVERKHQNISAVLIEEGVPYISGYKPLGNHQRLLREVVLEQLRVRLTTRALIEAEIERVPEMPMTSDILTTLVPPPSPRPGMNRPSDAGQSERARAPIDYLLLEALNRALGLAGEEFVLAFERRRLIAARKERLAAQITHVSVVEGDGAGYDILSFGEDGSERLVEVKSTKFGEYTPFYVSRNEVNVSIKTAPSYHLYRLYEFGRVSRLFVKPGSLESSFALEPSSYLARVG